MKLGILFLTASAAMASAASASAEDLKLLKCELSDRGRIVSRGNLVRADVTAQVGTDLGLEPPTQDGGREIGAVVTAYPLRDGSRRILGYLTFGHEYVKVKIEDITTRQLQVEAMIEEGRLLRLYCFARASEIEPF